MKELYGLFGETLSHSLSPQIHSFIFHQIGLDASYHLFPLRRQDLPVALDGLKVLGAKGINVTIPYKSDVLALLDEVSPEARTIGAVNTIRFGTNGLIGYNTDYRGFGYSLSRHNIATTGKRAVVLGTGGAAKTVACFLRDHGVGDLHLVTRDVKATTDKMPLWTYDELARSGGDLLVNCTPVGMYPHVQQVLLDRSVIAGFESVVDLVYNPIRTKLLSDAAELGLLYCNGLSMLIAQAVYAEEIWQNRTIEMKLMEPLYEILNKGFEGCGQ